MQVIRRYLWIKSIAESTLEPKKSPFASQIFGGFLNAKRVFGVDASGQYSEELKKNAEERCMANVTIRHTTVIYLGFENLRPLLYWPHNSFELKAYNYPCLLALWRL